MTFSSLFAKNITVTFLKGIEKRPVTGKVAPGGTKPAPFTQRFHRETPALQKYVPINAFADAVVL